jgi:hypothetical protein
LPASRPPSVTDHFAAIADAAGLVVLTLDPRATQPTHESVSL